MQHFLGETNKYCIDGYEFFSAMHDVCLYQPVKHKRKHFIVYVYIFMHFQMEKYPTF
jgi:hypothetical protein